MERKEIKELFGKNFLGVKEQEPFLKILGGKNDFIQESPVQFCESDLQKAAENGYILIYGLSNINNQIITLKYFRDVFGVNPDASEPCLYNQDWYMKETFVDKTLEDKWYLIKKEVIEESRAVMPNELEQQGIVFPSAILCCYTFFAYYFTRQEYLWWHDFVWCCDTDHNGDRIYVGKYHDIDGVNKNGFSIHRHLALRSCYASINCV